MRRHKMWAPEGIENAYLGTEINRMEKLPQISNYIHNLFYIMIKIQSSFFRKIDYIYRDKTFVLDKARRL